VLLADNPSGVNTTMIFDDAKKTLQELVSEFKAA
jgi:hypothetical protein